MLALARSNHRKGSPRLKCFESLNLSLNLMTPKNGGVRRFGGHRHGQKKSRV